MKHLLPENTISAILMKKDIKQWLGCLLPGNVITVLWGAQQFYQSQTTGDQSDLNRLYADRASSSYVLVDSFKNGEWEGERPPPPPPLINITEGITIESTEYDF